MFRRNLLLGALATASAGSLARPASATTTAGVSESPFVCDRLALTPTLRHRHFDELGPWLRTKVTAVRPLSNGYEFRFATDWQTFSNLSEWINGERICCPFFDIDLRV